MGLADLKKNSTQSRALSDSEQRSVSLSDLIEDFIDDAIHYAAGQPQQSKQFAQVITLETGFNGMLSAQIPSQKELPKSDKPYRKATFTLSESAIAHLAELASGCDLAKSKLIRLLIEHYYSLDKSEQMKIQRRIMVK